VKTVKDSKLHKQDTSQQWVRHTAQFAWSCLRDYWGPVRLSPMILAQGNLVTFDRKSAIFDRHWSMWCVNSLARKHLPTHVHRNFIL